MWLFFYQSIREQQANKKFIFLFQKKEKHSFQNVSLSFILFDKIIL